jgi:hypothetical protein
VVCIYITTHTHTHTKHFISILRIISAASSVLAACLSRVSVVYYYRCSFHMSSQLLCHGLWLCCSDVKISWLGGWANQWRPPHNHKNSSLLWSTDTYIGAFCLQVQCRPRKENYEGEVGVMQETKGKAAGTACPSESSLIYFGCTCKWNKQDGRKEIFLAL